MELRFTVWQFVRLMVRLEGAAPSDKTMAELLAAWQDVWQPLDAELGELAERDDEAYGAMMMDQDVIIEDATLVQAETAQRALQSVMDAMDDAIAAGGEDELIDSLKFERRELRQLTRKLGRMADGAS